MSGHHCRLSDINDVFPNHIFSFRYAVTAHRAGRNEASDDVALPQYLFEMVVRPVLRGGSVMRASRPHFYHNSASSTDPRLLQKPLVSSARKRFVASLNVLLGAGETDGDQFGTGIKRSWYIA